MTKTYEQKESTEDLAIRWFIRACDKMNKEEYEAFERWRSVPEHRKAYEEVAGAWSTLDACAPAYKSISAAKVGKPLFTRRSFMYAAASLALGISTYGIYRHRLSSPVFSREFVSRPCEILNVELPDNTHVSLDTDTKLEVIFYRDRRETKLYYGQVMLDVMPDPSRVFQVTTGKTVISVLGTRFSVRNTEGIVKVAVKEGHVLVQNTMSSRILDLLPSDGIIMDNSRIIPVKVSPELIGTWQHGRIAFENATLDDVIKEFARYGEKRLVASPEVKDIRVTGNFDITSSGNFVATLPSVVPIRYVKKGDKLLIVKRQAAVPE